MSGPVVQIEGLGFSWPGSSFQINVPKLSLASGERLLLTGSSGSGKSTLLALIAGIVVPDSGRILLAGRDMGGVSGAERDKLRAESCGIIFQQFNLLPYLSVIDNVLLPLNFAPERRERAGHAQETARELLEKLDLGDPSLWRQPAGRLSVGQQQRVAAARALIGRPQLIIADEPTSALDADRQHRFLELLFAEAQSAQAAVLMVSHDLGLGPSFDRMTALSEIAQIKGSGND